MRFAWGLLLLVACFGGCIDAGLVPCGELECASGSVCTPGGCALPADVNACDGLTDGAACSAADGDVGTCQGGACRTGTCGNGKVDVGEVCDDGNQLSGDGCRGDCKKIEVCGDGVLDQGEECDDGNMNADDGCDTCKRTTWVASTIVGSALTATLEGVTQPTGTATDGLGRVYFTSGSRVLRVELDGSLTTVAGTGQVGTSGDGGQATSASLVAPAQIALDGLGRLIIADAGGNRVRRVALDGTISTLAGFGAPEYTGDGGPATSAGLTVPSGVAVDALGRVVIADTAANRIRRIELGGTISTIAGTGTFGYNGDGSAATSTQIANPQQLAYDPQGRLLIADLSNFRVRRLELDGTLTTIAGTGVPMLGADGVPAIDSAMFPQGVAVDAQGNIVVADSGEDRVRRIDTNGIITTIANAGASLGYNGDAIAATTAELNDPTSVAFDNQGRVVIADKNNNRVRRIELDGTISTIAGTGSPATVDGQPATSVALAPAYAVVDAGGRIVLSDQTSARILRVDVDGSITSIAGTGTNGTSGDGGPATAAGLDHPLGIAIDPQGRVLIACACAVRRIELDGTIDTFAGKSTCGSTGDGGMATNAMLQRPTGLVFDPAGNLYIADAGAARVRMVDPTNMISTVVGNGTTGPSALGSPATNEVISKPTDVAFYNGTLYVTDAQNNDVIAVANAFAEIFAGQGSGPLGDGGPALAATLSAPQGIATDATGRIYLADAGTRIRMIDLGGNITTIAGGHGSFSGDGGPATAAGITAPIGVTVDASGRLLFVESIGVRRVALDGTINTVAGAIEPDRSGATAIARLADPQQIVVTPDFTLVASGSALVLDLVRGGKVMTAAGAYPQNVATGNLARFRTRTSGNVGGVAFDAVTGTIYMTEGNRIDAVTIVDPANPDTWTIAPLANSASALGFLDGPAATAMLRSPTGLLLDSTTHTLYIADSGNNAIRALDLASSTMSTIVNTEHVLGFAGDGGAASTALLFGPTALATCPNGDLFIADTSNNRVRRISAGMISTVIGDGSPSSSGEGSPANGFPVEAPAGVACDASGNVVVSSTTTVRLLPADVNGVVDGTGTVETIYGAPPRVSFPSSETGCLTAVAVIDAVTIEVADACSGLLVELTRTTQ